MNKKDYYKTLNISEFATEQEIKSAYRRLARIHHPDIAGVDSMTMFKEINEAYEILINKQKRYEYDALRRLYSYAENKETKFNQTPKSESKVNKKQNTFWDDFINYQRQKQSNSNFQPQNGTDITTEVVLSLSEAVNGTSKKINILHTKPCSHCQGRKFVNGCRCSFCNGSGTESEHKKLTVKIPANVKNGYKIRIAGEGNQGVNGGTNGNLYLLIKIENISDFKYDGVDVYRTVPITPAEAVLGANIEIMQADGTITMKILPNTNSGQKFRLQGQGITQNGITGDMIVTVEIQIPKEISEEELDLYRKLAKLNSKNIRKVF